MFKNGRSSALILILIFYFAFNTSSAQERIDTQASVTIAIGDWSPYVSPQKPFLGILPHIVSAAYELQGISTEYQFTDWHRAYEQVKSADVPVSIAWVYDTERAKEMYFSEPISHITLSFFHRASMNFTWKKIDDLKPYKIGYVKDYSYGDKFNVAVERKQLVATQYDDPIKAFQALQQGEIDLLPSDKVVGQDILNDLNSETSSSIIFDEHPLHITPVHMIASLDNEEGMAWVDRFNQGVNKLKQSGRYRNIISSSNLIDSIAQLSFLTEENAPLNYQVNGRAKGVSIAIVAEILKELESNITPEYFEIQPWARAYHALLNHNNTVLFSIAQTPERKDKFQWVGPIYRTNVVLFANKNNRPIGNSIQDFSQNKICAVREDVGAQLIASMGHPEEHSHLVHSPVQCAKMLHLGRVDMWVYGSDTGRWYLSKTGAQPEQFEEVSQLHESFRYIAFSDDVSQEIVYAFQKTLDYLHINGRLNEIIKAELASSQGVPLP